MSLFLYRFPFTSLFLFRYRFRFRFQFRFLFLFLFPFPFLFRIPVSGFRLFQTPLLKLCSRTFVLWRRFFVPWTKVILNWRSSNELPLPNVLRLIIVRGWTEFSYCISVQFSTYQAPSSMNWRCERPRYCISKLFTPSSSGPLCPQFFVFSSSTSSPLGSPVIFFTPFLFPSCNLKKMD